MKKRWEVFWLAEAGIILIYILLCLAAGRVLIAAGAAAVCFSAQPRGGPRASRCLSLVEPVLLHGSLHPE